MTKTEATAIIRQTLDEILVALGEDFDLLEACCDDALNQIYTETEQVIDN